MTDDALRWHLSGHHVNGLSTLSGGDKTTYFKIVNHEKHNTDFFYALLVVRRNPGGSPRYEVKHYVFRRNDDSVYEIPTEQVRLVDSPVLWPLNPEAAASSSRLVQQSSHENAPNLERAKDQEFFAEFYPDPEGAII